MRRAPWFIALALALEPSSALAHPLQFGTMIVTERTDRVFDVAFRFDGSEAQPGGVAPLLPDHCRRIQRFFRSEDENGLQQLERYDCSAEPLDDQIIGVTGITAVGTQVRLEVRLLETPKLEAILDWRESTLRLGSKRTSGGIFLEYLELGVEHILIGIDHLMFVLGLLLLVRTRRRLVLTITSFTIGHSVTLALSVLNLVQVPQDCTEAGIALSILVLAIELVRDDGESPTLTARYPELVAVLFGLLHGLGFAGALRETGIIPGEVPTILFAFNLGVELGQLMFVGIALGIAWGIRGLIKERPRWTSAVLPYFLGISAAYFAIDRIVVMVGQA